MLNKQFIQLEHTKILNNTESSEKLLDQIAIWAIKEGVTHKAFGNLFKIL